MEIRVRGKDHACVKFDFVLSVAFIRELLINSVKGDCSSGSGPEKTVEMVRYAHVHVRTRETRP